jgi:ribosome maturation factor RimP
MQGGETVEREVEKTLAAAMPEVDLREVVVVGRGDSAMLRAVVDHPSGVDHQLCVAVTRALDGAGLLERFGVEVSSPGPKPPLRTTEHFRAALGSRVHLRVETGDGVRSRAGTLVAVDDRSLTVANSAGMTRVERSAIRRARLVPASDAPGPGSET